MIAFSKSRLATRTRLASLELVGQTGGVWLKFLEQVAELGGDRLFMRQSANNRALPSPRSGSALWQVGSLIPGKQGTRCP